jgi:glycosyltransferase involved in cell wall biosynthesis
VFLFIGRLLRDKGVREFVQASRLVKAKRPDVRFQLLGEVDPGNRTSVTAAELRSWVDEGVVEHLQEQQDVRPFIAAATAVVLPSYREGMSRALLEAAAMARPLVGSDVPGVRELVEEGVTGARFAPRDAVSLAKAIARIAEAPPETLRRYGWNAREKVEREFSEEAVVQAYLKVIGELVGRER